MVQVHITQSGKNYGSKDNYMIFNDFELNFKNIKQAKQYLADEYGNCKRENVYRDKKDGTPRRVGYIYCFNNKDISHDSQAWHQQDWVTFHKITPITV